MTRAVVNTQDSLHFYAVCLVRPGTPAGVNYSQGESNVRLKQAFSAASGKNSTVAV